MLADEHNDPLVRKAVAIAETLMAQAKLVKDPAQLATVDAYRDHVFAAVQARIPDVTREDVEVVAKVITDHLRELIAEAKQRLESPAG